MGAKGRGRLSLRGSTNERGPGVNSNSYAISYDKRLGDISYANDLVCNTRYPGWPPAEGRHTLFTILFDMELSQNSARPLLGPHPMTPHHRATSVYMEPGEPLLVYRLNARTPSRCWGCSLISPVPRLRMRLPLSYA